MGTTPEVPRGPMVPPPPRSSSHIVAIALLVLGLIIVVSGFAVWVGLRIISRGMQVRVEEGGRGQKEVTIRTPVGSLQVHKDVNEASLGLPIYPGAAQVRDEGGATVDLQFPNEQGVRIIAGKFETADGLDKVKDFYRGRLGTEVTKYTDRTHDGKTVFEIKRQDEERVVALKDKGDGTLIELVHVTHGTAEVN